MWVSWSSSDAGGGVGEAEALEGGEDVASGGLRGAALGQQAGDAARSSPSALRSLGFDQSEDQESDPDDAGQRVDAVVVVEEDRADLEGLFVVAVAALDDLLAFVVRVVPGRRSGVAGEVGRERVDPVRCERPRRSRPGCA